MWRTINWIQIPLMTDIQVRALFRNKLRSLFSGALSKAHVLSSSGRADPDCALGHILKALFKNDDFMSKLVSSYIMSPGEEFELNCTASRLLLNVMPALESALVFQETVSRQDFTGFDLNLLFHWPAGPVISEHQWSTQDFTDPKLLEGNL